MKYRNQVFDKARGVGNQQFRSNPLQVAGMDPRSTYAANQVGMNSGTADMYRQAQGGLGIGMDAMNRGLGMQWGADAAQQYMNPYQSQVMDQWNQQFGDMRQNTLNDVNQQAMQSGAFGGSRHGVAEGQALADLGKQQSMQQAQMLQQGYGDAYNQFSNDRGALMQGGQGMANLGFSGGQGLQGLAQQQMQFGDANRQIAQSGNDAKREEFLRGQGWNQQQLGAMIAAMNGAPYNKKGQQVTKTPGNLFGDILGVGGLVGSFL
jgi:hypothetical protein